METIRDRLILGFQDGTVCVLLIGDPEDPQKTLKILCELNSRGGSSGQMKRVMDTRSLLRKWHRITVASQQSPVKDLLLNNKADI